MITKTYKIERSNDKVEMKEKQVETFRGKIRRQEETILFSIPKEFVKNSFENEMGAVITAQYPGQGVVYFVGSEKCSGPRTSLLAVTALLCKTKKGQKTLLKQI